MKEKGRKKKEAKGKGACVCVWFWDLGCERRFFFPFFVLLRILKELRTYGDGFCYGLDWTGLE